MCNLSYGIAERSLNEGMQKGIMEGMQKGIVEGMDKGVTKNRLDSLRALMSQLNIDFDRAADLLLIPASDRDNLRKQLDQK